jgi:hypothetical protein
VVCGEDDQRVLPETPVLKRVKHPSHLVVDQPDVLVHVREIGTYFWLVREVWERVDPLRVGALVVVVPPTGVGTVRPSDVWLEEPDRGEERLVVWCVAL